MLEECDSSDEDATLYIISEQCRLKQRVSDHTQFFLCTIKKKYIFVTL